MKKENSSKGTRNTIQKLLLLICNGVGFLASIITIITVFSTEDTPIRYISCIIALCYFICLGIYVARYIVKSIFNTQHARAELEREYFRRNTKAASDLNKFYYNLTNITSSICSLRILTYQDVIDKYKNLCDYLVEFYNSFFYGYLCDNKISVCIKLVKTEMIFDENYMGWSMETIARSASTDHERTSIDDKPVKISENTDFQVILSNKYPDELFAICDMRNIKDDFLKLYEMPYQNSRGENFLEYYQSTIVIPIKSEYKYIDKELKAGNTRDNGNFVLGFLCIDSMKAFETEAEKTIFRIGVEYAKSFATTLYPLFEKVLISCKNNAKMNKETQDIEKP